MRQPRALALALLLGSGALSHPATSRPLSRLGAARGPQAFHLNIADGGAIVLTKADGGAHLSTITSSFSEPGPVLHNLSTSSGSGWEVSVDHSGGVWTVEARAKTFRLKRTVALDPPHAPRRVLINDTLSTPTGAAAAPPLATGLPGPTDVIGIRVAHTATVAESGEQVEAALTPGTYGVWQCGTESNPGDTCASPCLDPYVKYTNNGRPDVFANTSSGFGIGLTALDDVFRVQAQTLQAAMKSAPRMPTMGCEVTDPPTIRLSDPSFGMRASGDEYTMEWAVYPFVGPTAAAEGAAAAGAEVPGDGTDAAAGCTDYCEPPLPSAPFGLLSGRPALLHTWSAVLSPERLSGCGVQTASSTRSATTSRATRSPSTRQDSLGRPPRPMATSLPSMALDTPSAFCRCLAPARLTARGSLTNIPKES